MKNTLLVIVRPNPRGLINRTFGKRSDLDLTVITVAGQSGIRTRVLLNPNASAKVQKIIDMCK